MKEHTHEQQVEAVAAGIAKSRDELAELAAGLKRLAEWPIDKSSAHAQDRPERPVNGNRHGGWTGFRHGIDRASTRSMKVADGLAVEIERHPLIGGMAAFGLGFGLATLLFKRNGHDFRS